MDKYNGMKQDIMLKRAAMIAKNVELNQEFHFGHPTSRIRINQIYNSHFKALLSGIYSVKRLECWKIVGTGL